MVPKLIGVHTNFRGSLASRIENGLHHSKAHDAYSQKVRKVVWTAQLALAAEVVSL